MFLIDIYRKWRAAGDLDKIDNLAAKVSTSCFDDTPHPHPTRLSPIDVKRLKKLQRQLAKYGCSFDHISSCSHRFFPIARILQKRRGGSCPYVKNQFHESDPFEFVEKFAPNLNAQNGDGQTFLMVLMNGKDKEHLKKHVEFIADMVKMGKINLEVKDSNGSDIFDYARRVDEGAVLNKILGRVLGRPVEKNEQPVEILAAIKKSCKVHLWENLDISELSQRYAAVCTRHRQTLDAQKPPLAHVDFSLLQQLNEQGVSSTLIPKEMLGTPNDVFPLILLLARFNRATCEEIIELRTDDLWRYVSLFKPDFSQKDSSGRDFLRVVEEDCPHLIMQNTSFFKKLVKKNLISRDFLQKEGAKTIY